MEEQKKSQATVGSTQFQVPHSSIPVVNESESPVGFNLAQLTRFKRQFITMTKAGSVQGHVGDLFVQYLNSQFTQNWRRPKPHLLVKRGYGRN